MAVRSATCDYASRERIGRLVGVALLVSGAVHAQSVSPGADVRSGVIVGPATLAITPAFGNDLDPGPPADIVAATWRLRQQPFGSSVLPNASIAPPLQLQFKLQPMFGISPFLSTHLGPRLGALLPSMNIGAGFVTGPLHFGTRFGVRRDEHALWLRNASFARYVRPAFDVGIETVNEFALGADAQFAQRALLGSAALHPDPDAPMFRMNTTLFPTAGRTFSSVSTFGRF